jgi:predicted aconitase with swiveling domain
MAGVMRGTPLVSGAAVGEALVSREPLSFWGGYDHRTGEIIDRRHPLAGQNAAGKVLILPYARGSSTTTAVLLEALRAGTAPAAILTTAAETFFALAAIVAGELYQRSIPVVILDEHDAANLRSGMRLRDDADGTIAIETDRSS